MQHPVNILHIFLLAFFGLSSLMGRAQADLTPRGYYLAVAEDTVRLDTLSIKQGSFAMLEEPKGASISGSAYELDAAKARLVWRERPALDSVWVQYEVLAIYFGTTYRHKSDTLIAPRPTIIHNPFTVTEEGGSEVFDFGNLDYNGSFARGISVGNTQNLVLNSNFNLQLNGQLGDGIGIRAAMTDDNIPIQPEGNTQQIQDFDKVFIEFTKGPNTLTVGDYYLQGQPAHFLNYNKNLQGGRLEYHTGLDTQRTLDAEVSTAVTRGAFARNTFTGEEGNQGPYRLQGNNGENFLIVIAGTERVWIDGDRMERGSENDYVIDYNSGEISFTPNQLITKDSRIVVEFEYAVQNYFRSLVQGGASVESDKTTWSVNVYSEQDAKNQPLFEPLDSAQQAVLAQVGDSLSNAVIPGYRQVGYDSEQIRYRRTDSLVEGQTYEPVFVYSNNSEEAEWQVRFSFVGQGEGNYMIAGNNVNGRVYEWVAPENGQPQGSYEPVINAVAPQVKQTATIGHEYRFSENTALSAEMAISNQDVNTFSDRHDADDEGVGTFLTFTHYEPLREDSVAKSGITVDGKYEFTNRHFVPVTNYRAVEFSRNWNVRDQLIGGNQHLGQASARFGDSRWGQVQYGLETFLADTTYQGFRHGLQAAVSKGGLHFTTNTTYLTSQAPGQQTTFFRPKANLRQDIGWMQIGYDLLMDDNRIYDGDSMLPSAISFDENTFFLRTNDTVKNPLELSYMHRRERLPGGGRLQLATIANEARLKGTYIPGPTHQLHYTVTFRELQVEDTTLIDQQKQQSALGRVNYNTTLFDGFIRGNVLLETGTGREQEREYAFLEVPEGQGDYIWNDDGDSIQEVSEFEQASESDAPYANFVRVFQPTSEFIPVSSSGFNASLNLLPSSIFKQQEGFGLFLGKWSNNTSVQINKKVVATEQFASFNPFELSVDDTSLVTVSSLIRNTLYYNRLGKKFSASSTYQDNRNKQLLTYGPEHRINRKGNAGIRWNFNKEIQTDVEAATGLRANYTTGIEDRNFQYDFYEMSPSLTYQQGNTFRLVLDYDYSEKTNAEEYGGEVATINEFTVEGRYNVVNKSNLTARFSYTNIDFTGEGNTPLAYSMLEGLNNGRNYLWNVSYELRMSDNIEISFSYNGQQRGDAETRHTGNAQVRAIF